jgi:hypothetical protein
MKKTLLTIMATVCVMAIGCGVYVAGVRADYEAKLEESICEHETEIGFVQDVRLELMSECNDLTKRVSELEDAVWNIMEHNDYDVSIERDGVVHTFKSEREDNGIFTSKTHITDVRY